MTYSKFLLLALGMLATAGFATTECLNMAGTYQCTMPEDHSPIDITVTQTLNAENATILTLKGPGFKNNEATYSYIADKQPHDNYIASCTESHFSIFSPMPNNPGYYIITTYLMPTADSINIEKHIITLQMTQDNTASLNVVQDLGTLSCTKTQ